jgi:hypothetical protein
VVAAAPKRAKKAATCQPAKKSTRATKAATKPSKRRPSARTIKEVIDIRPALGRLGIDFAEELAWAYAA